MDETAMLFQPPRPRERRPAPPAAAGVPRRFNIGTAAIDRWASVDPDRVAVLDLHGAVPRAATFEALRQRSDRLALALRRLGVAVGDRVGVPWLGSTDGTCAWCRRGAENLCVQPTFTGWDIDGGYADACLAEDMVAELRGCIRTDLDCADICEATGRVVSRQTEPDMGLLRAQLQACVAACRACGDACEQHAGMHEHCRVCAASCRRCEESCNRLLQQLG